MKPSPGMAALITVHCDACDAVAERGAPAIGRFEKLVLRTFPDWEPYAAVETSPGEWCLVLLCPRCVRESDRAAQVALLTLQTGQRVARGQYGRALFIRTVARIRRRQGFAALEAWMGS